MAHEAPTTDLFGSGEPSHFLDMLIGKNVDQNVNIFAANQPAADEAPKDRPEVILSFAHIFLVTDIQFFLTYIYFFHPVLF